MRGRTRHAAAAVVTLGAAGLLLAGCTLPDGIDGNLASGWDAMPEPVSFTPEVGVCHPDDYQEEGTLAEYGPVDCAGPHRTQTVHVGEFSGEAAGRVTPPTAGSDAWDEAFQQCEEGAAGYLGADFRHGELMLRVTVPSETAWEGGAHWLRCDVTHRDGDDLEGSLAGALQGGSDLLLGCYVATIDESTDSVESLDAVACSEPHDTEFVGVYQYPDDTHPGGGSDDVWQGIHEGCREQVAEFADVPVDDELTFRTGTIVVPADRDSWDYGDRGVRCYLWLNYEVSESKEGAGTRGLPVQ